MIAFNRDMANALIADAKTMVESLKLSVGRAVSPTGRMTTYVETLIDIELNKVVLGLENTENNRLEKLGIGKCH
jgi:hypothetical protein